MSRPRILLGAVILGLLVVGPAHGATGLDDAMQPLVPAGGPAPNVQDFRDTARPTPAASAAVSLADRLAAIPSARRADAEIELELGRNAAEATRAAADRVATLWNGGAWDLAVAELRLLESDGTTPGLGIAWTPGRYPPARSGGTDVRIGGTRTEAQTVSLDFDAATGHVFSVVRWGSTTGTSAWTANISVDGGATWYEAYAWNSAVGIVDVDAAVVGGYVYVGYVAGDVTNEARVRRCLVSSGAVDGPFGFHVAIDAGTSGIKDVALASNADDYDNRIYYAAIQDDHALRFALDDAADGTTFADYSPAVTNASAGLAVTWNHHYTCTDYVFVSYSGTDGSIWVQSLSSTAWTGTAIEPNAGTFYVTSISAYGQTVICAFEYPFPAGVGIRYRISYSCGSSWSAGTLAMPDGVTTIAYYEPAVDARNGNGTAIVYQEEAGDFDLFHSQWREGFAPGGWTERTPINDHDVYTGSHTGLSFLPPIVPASLSHGAAYISLDPSNRVLYFDRPELAPVDAPVIAGSDPGLRLLPAAPNPFTGRTTIRFALPESGPVRLTVHNVLGERVADVVDGTLGAGPHAFPFEAGRLGSGIYWYRLTTDTGTRTNSMVHVR